MRRSHLALFITTAALSGAPAARAQTAPAPVTDKTLVRPVITLPSNDEQRRLRFQLEDDFRRNQDNLGRPDPTFADRNNILTTKIAPNMRVGPNLGGKRGYGFKLKIGF